MAVTLSQETNIPQLIRLKDLDRQRAYRENLDFYSGRQWPTSPRQREKRLTFNYAKVLIDKVSSYLMSNLNFGVDPSQGMTDQEAQRAEEALYQVYQENNLELLDLETEIDTAHPGGWLLQGDLGPRRGQGAGHGP